MRCLTNSTTKQLTQQQQNNMGRITATTTTTTTTTTNNNNDNDDDIDNGNNNDDDNNQTKLDSTNMSHRLSIGWKNCPCNCPLVCNDWLYSSHSRFVSLFLINLHWCIFFLWRTQFHWWKCNSDGWFNCISQFITNIKPPWKSSGQRTESVFSFAHFSPNSKSN